MQFYAGFWGALFSGLLLAVGGSLGIGMLTPVMPDMTNTLYIAGAAVAATIAGVLGVYAYRSAPASTLAPLQYLEIVSATVLGWWVFDHLPDAIKWLGIAIIISSGLYVIWRERQVGKTATIPTVNTPI
jgi:S-adenosylmethionine uptake transporter